jgi:hypothetical protein
MTCMTCKYSEPPKSADGKVVLGQGVRVCKRNPPVPILVPVQNGVSMQSVYPMVGLTDECGEFRAHEDEGDVARSRTPVPRESMS